MTNPHDKAIEAAAEVLFRESGTQVLWKDAGREAHKIWIDAARAAIAAYERAMWRPIEEAPKDGTPIQVTHLPFTGRPPFNAVRWSHGPQKSQWRWRILGHERSPLRYTPTHFRPLPKPEGI